jgi:hypothetical protein
MNVKLVNSLFAINTQGEWIYLGTDYMRMRTLEKKFIGKRVKLNKYIEQESKLQRKNILDWIDRQCIENNDSLSWWMTHIAGKNNMASQFFDYLIQISAIKRRLKGQDSGQITIICENSFLLQSVKDNLKYSHRVTVNFGWWFCWLSNRLFFLSRSAFHFFKQITWFLQHWINARKSRVGEKLQPKGEVFVVHQCLDTKSFLMEGRLACRYLTVLPAWLEAQGRHVFRLPWLHTVNLPLSDVYKKLRSSNCFIPEDWLNLKDYIKIFLASFSSQFAIKFNVPYPGLNIHALVCRERYVQLGDSLVLSRFWRYGPSIKKWGALLDSLTIYDTYEAMPPEHVQIYVSRSGLSAKTKFFGYLHSLITRDFLGYHVTNNDINSIVYPNIIVTNGSLAKDLLLSQGHDEKNIRIGPALRSVNYAKFPQPEEKYRENLLLALSLIPESVMELLDKIYQLRNWLSDVGIPVHIKCHPMMTKSTVLAIMKWESLPKGWCWREEDIQVCLENAWCSITINSSSIVDIVRSGCIPFSLTRSLATSWNYLDILTPDYPFLNTISDENIKSELEQIFIKKREFYKLKTLELKNNFDKFFNPINDKTLHAFH